MTKKRTFKPQLKAQAVLQLLSGSKSAAQICRDLNINEALLSRWKQQLLTHAPTVFETDSEVNHKDQHIAELQQMVGRLTMELEIAKKASQVVIYQTRKNGR